MTLLHPSRVGSTVTVWFVAEQPVRLICGGSRFRVVGTPRCADINGARYWRMRARGADARECVFDLRQTGEDWTLVGVADATLTGGL